MNAHELKAKIDSGAFDADFKMLYGECENAAKRYKKAIDGFVSVFGDGNGLRLFSAPGRTEVGGNHTDHQHGCVLAGAVNLDVIAVVNQTGGKRIRIKSEGFEMDTVDAAVLEPQQKENNRSAALIRGVAAGFGKMGYDIGGFDAYTTSNVLKGSGLSSSAAFEVLVSNIVNTLFCNSAADAVQIAKISQSAERDYFGKPCGLLDQMASSVGGFTYADFNDPSNPEVRKTSVDLTKSGCTLCVVDTGGNHSNLTGDYADITIECKKISNALGVEFLRDADEEKFYKDMASLRISCGDRAVLRAFHFFNENRRVGLQKAALEKGDFAEFFRLVNESGDSSYKYLQNVYSNHAANEQGISLALAVTSRFLGNSGACRVHGGGFAGTIQCYVPDSRLSEYVKTIEWVFGKGSCHPLHIRPIGGYELTEK